MLRQILLLALLLGIAAPSFAKEKNENWLEVRSDHFVVATDASEKQGRRVADQFEHMRSVFHITFPKMQIDPAAPIIVLAVKDEKDFRTLEPEAYLARGQIKLGGLFLRGPDKNYVLMCLDAQGEHPYEVIYHEYTHLVLGKSAEWLPLWFNEGLAEFYQNTEIREKEVLVGEPSGENLALLRQNSLLPLATLFKVDQQSPYYHEENKGSIFYAESWALTHYLFYKDFHEKSQSLIDYAELLAKNVDPVEAATRAFGDLQKLQFALEGYVRQARFGTFKMSASIAVDDSTFKVRPLTSAQADAVQADFLAYNQRTADARSLLDRVLKDDPNNVSAHETMGFLEFQARHLDEAREWYAQAVQLDSQSYLAHYYFAAISMNGPLAPSDEAQVEASLRAAIKLNPSFAPTYDRLAVFLAMRHHDLDEAHMMTLQAVSLDPANFTYRVNVANVLLAMQQPKNAVEVLRNAVKLAKTQEESQMADNLLMHAQEYATALDQDASYRRQMAESKPRTAQATDDDDDDDADDANASAVHQDTFVAKGPHHFQTGVLKDVRCKSTKLDLTINSSARALALHTENYFNIQFTTLNFKPSGDLNPCKDLEGRPAKVEYVESADKSVVPRVLAIELHK